MKKQTYLTFIKKELMRLSSLNTTNKFKLVQINSYRVDTFIIADMIESQNFKISSTNNKLKQLSFEALEIWKELQNKSIINLVSKKERIIELQSAYKAYLIDLTKKDNLKNRYRKILEKETNLYTKAKTLNINSGNFFRFMKQKDNSAISETKIIKLVSMI